METRWPLSQGTYCLQVERLACSELTSPCSVAMPDVVTHHAFVIEFVHLLACY